MNIEIDTGNGVPIYLQIVEQIKRNVAMGRLRAEEGLPSVRQLAVDLTINPNTVARAYLELEHEGIIYKRQGQGTFVSAQAEETSRRERQREAAALLEQALAEAFDSGMTREEIGELYRRLIARYGKEQSS
ncbi:MAG TPA: GntR family transcriptional regulator [Bryobacteraceae bacterium]|nr:GntR family transcriptional regulator [Bryobacteraceae bacterium]